MDEQLDLEADIQGEMVTSADFIEGVTAFVEKRDPVSRVTSGFGRTGDRLPGPIESRADATSSQAPGGRHRRAAPARSWRRCCCFPGHAWADVLSPEDGPDPERAGDRRRSTRSSSTSASAVIGSSGRSSSTRCSASARGAGARRPRSGQHAARAGLDAAATVDRDRDHGHHLHLPRRHQATRWPPAPKPSPRRAARTRPSTSRRPRDAGRSTSRCRASSTCGATSTRTGGLLPRHGRPARTRR